MLIGYEIKDLVEPDEKLFEREIKSWDVCDLSDDELHGINFNKKIENKGLSQFILSVNDTQASTFHEYYIHRWFYELPPHKYISGSAKIWYLEDDFKSGSTLKVEVFLALNIPESQKPDNPCLTMNIPQPQRQGQEMDGQPNFEYIYFGDIHSHLGLEFIVKVEMHYSEINIAKKPTSFGLSEVTFHLGNELLNVTHPSSVECAANCDVCFGTKPSQCVSCSPGSHWHGYTCTNCHGYCAKCTGPTEYECLGCNFGFFDYGNGTCLEACKLPLKDIFSSSARFCISPCKPNEYIWNDTQICVPSCTPPLISFTDRFGHLFCSSPCSKKEDFLFPNRSCLSECPAPLAGDFEHGVHLCKNPCSPAEGYLYPTGKCSRACSVPFQIRIEPIAKFCENPCPVGSPFLYQNGSCSSACPSPLVTVTEDWVKLCKNPCSSKSDYLHINGSCLKDCPTPLRIRAEPIGRFCVNPCRSKNPFLYQNGSCLPTCPFPFKHREENEVRYCLPPLCSLNGEYILGDGSCSKECPLPLVRKTEVSVGTYCLNPCESDDHLISLSNNRSFSCVKNCPEHFEKKIKYGLKCCISPCLSEQFYFSHNRSCVDSCPYPLMITSKDGMDFCQNPCLKSNSFLYDDQSCYQSCPKPLRIEERNYCKSPCGGENKYLYSDGNCEEKCEYPYKISRKGNYKICQINLSRAEFVQVDQMRKIIEISNIASEIGGVLSCLINSGDPTSILMLPLLSMFEKIKYIKITLPLKIQLLLDQLSAPSTTRRDEKFLGIGILSMKALLIFGLSKLTQFWWLQKCDFILRWNILVPVFMGISGDIILDFFIIEQVKSPRGILGVILTISIFYKLFNVSRQREADLPRWKFLFEVFSENHQFFILTYFARIIVYHLILGLLYDHPHLQALLMMILSFGMCFYLIWICPVKKTLSKVQYFIIEIALLLYNFIFAILVFFDSKESSVIGVFGQLMNMFYLITSVLTTLVIIIKIILYIMSILCSPLVSSRESHIQLREINEERHFEAVNQVDDNNFDSEDDSIEPSIAIE